MGGVILGTSHINMGQILNGNRPMAVILKNGHGDVNYGK
jgi:hypothetical protein